MLKSFCIATNYPQSNPIFQSPNAPCVTALHKPKTTHMLPLPDKLLKVFT